MRIWMVMVMALVCTSLTACQTLKGMGQDITNAGEAIDRKL